LPEISIAQKRHIAQKLIDMTLRTFQLRSSERDQITIQFLSQPGSRRRADCHLEIRSHDLTAENKRAFAEEVAPMLVRSLHLHVKNRLAWLMGQESKMSPEVEVRFQELPIDEVSPSDWKVGDVFVAEWRRVA
jgi:phenylpyruvate tautomerase PptA (4-oxalocrotonate tautomerase family)